MKGRQVEREMECDLVEKNSVCVCVKSQMPILRSKYLDYSNFRDLYFFTCLIRYIVELVEVKV